MLTNEKLYVIYHDIRVQLSEKGSSLLPTSFVPIQSI